ncbi:MAG: sugar transferase [Alkalispirochaeta sp.]
MRRNLLKASLAVGDYLVMVASLSLMLLGRYGVEAFPEWFREHIVVFAVVFFVWIITFYVLEMYNINAPYSHRKFLVAMFVNVAIAITSIYAFLDIVDISPRLNLALMVAIFVPLFYGWRFVFTRTIDAMSITQAVAIIGSDSHALELAREIERQKRQGFRVVAIVRDADVDLPAWCCHDSIQVFDSVAELKSNVVELHISTLIVSDNWSKSIYTELYDLIPLRVQFFQLTSFWEQFLESIPIYSAKESWFLEHFNRGPTKGYAFLKRVIDLVAIIAFLPLILAISGFTAILVKISSKGPILFSQIRVGQNDRHYRLYKFRSMRTDAEANGPQWATERDPRVTAIGRFIRATRLDEIPQLYNVLTGDMSLVGPRPERPEFVTELAKEIPHYHLRHLVRPGLTGWAQVRYRYGASTEDAAVKLTYDLYYVKNVSLVLDIKIALKTILTVVGRQGR